MKPQQATCSLSVDFQLIPIKDLVYNKNVQRQHDANQLPNDYRDFDMNRLSAVRVNRRNGINYVFDGQYTIEIIASKSGSRDTLVWCMVYDEIQIQKEAGVKTDDTTAGGLYTPGGIQADPD